MEEEEVICINWSNTTDEESITLARGYTSLVTLVVSLLFFVLALYNLARRSTKYRKGCNCLCIYFLRYIANPFFLLAFVSLLPLAAFGVVLHHPEHNGQTLESTFCESGPGFILLWFESAEILALFVFSLYFVLYYIPCHNRTLLVTERTQLINDQKPEDLTINRRFKCHSFVSVLGLVVIMTVSAVYTMPPVVEHAINNTNIYSKVGPWCWITPESAQIYFWFIEEWVFMFISFIALSSALVMLCCVTRDTHARYRCFPSVWWDKMIFVPFLIFYTYFLMHSALVAIEIAVHIFENCSDWLWYTYAIGKPLSKVLLVIASLQLMSTSYRMVQKRPPLLSDDAETVTTLL